ncbi:STAS domain-containing protein [Planomonospora corallina]|uniref:Anti-sigma factor antagonist n=1 Tax=Planomonospora corallina TaxID=1806052 RepID=A0ABV8I155_9ACTN
MTTVHAARTQESLLAVCRPPHTIIALRGEIDAASAPALRKRLRNALQRSADLLILDLAAVSFCDASGLSVLVDIRQRSGESGITLRLVAPRPHLTRLLRITGLHRGFAVHPTLSSALAVRGRDPMAGGRLAKLRRRFPAALHGSTGK